MKTCPPQGLPNISGVTGTIQMYAWLTAPSGYLICDGSAVSRTTYSALFNVIGINYGAGNGSSTFNLPNFKGMVPVGLDSSQTEFNTLGKTGGEKNHTLTIEETPAHKHSYLDNYGVQNVEVTFYNGTATDEIERWEDTSTVGGGLAHNNLQPYCTISFVIKY